MKEALFTVDKKWGKEVWIVNNESYCGKFLFLNKNAKSSLHRHFKKKETFMGLRGHTRLTIGKKTHSLRSFSRPETISPMVWHQFWGITNAVLLEVSTHHNDDDVERRTESVANTFRGT